MTVFISVREFNSANYVAGTNIADIIKTIRLLVNGHKIKLFNKQLGLSLSFISVIDKIWDACQINFFFNVIKNNAFAIVTNHLLS